MRLRYSPAGMTPPDEERPPAPGRPSVPRVGVRERAWTRPLEWIRRPGAGADLAGVGLALAVLAATYFALEGVPRGTRPAPALPPGLAARLWALPERMATPARLELAGTGTDPRPARKEGAAVGLWFQVEAASRPLVLERQAELRTIQLFPRPGQRSEPEPPGRRVFVTDAAGGPYLVRDPPGPRRVRLLVFPPDVDPLALSSAELARIAPRVTVIERRYVAAFRDVPDE
jgi:hypothetical protein